MYLRDFFALKPFRDYSLCSVCILPQPAFYPQSAVCILHAVGILPLVRNLQSAVRSLRLTLTANFYIAGSNFKKNDHGIVIRSRHWLRAMLTNFSYSAMGRTHLIFWLGGCGGHFPFWSMNVFFGITICKNYFHQKKSLQELFFAIQCYFIIPRKKNLKQRN